MTNEHPWDLALWPNQEGCTVLRPDWIESSFPGIDIHGDYQEVQAARLLVVYLNALEQKLARYEAALTQVVDKATLPWPEYWDKYGLDHVNGSPSAKAIASEALNPSASVSNGADA